MFEILPCLQACFTSFPEAGDRIVVLSRREVWCRAGNGELPRWQEVAEFLPQDAGIIQIGTLDGCRCFAVELEAFPENFTGVRVCQIREFLFIQPESYQNALCRARGLLSWLNAHRFCGRCGGKLEPSTHDSGLNCPACRGVYYPQLAPAVIVAITRNGGKELLLAHNRNFSGQVYSLIAGFVEAGETVENALCREVYEECGIRVKNLQYVTSQVWPFPNSLMLAFTAEYESGNALADGEELSDLGWFTRDDHPELPAPGSVARKVIDLVFSR